MWELHGIVGVAEGMEPVVSMVGVVAVLYSELEFGGEEGGGAGHVACSEWVGDAGSVAFDAGGLEWGVGEVAVGADPSCFCCSRLGWVWV